MNFDSKRPSSRAKDHASREEASWDAMIIKIAMMMARVAKAFAIVVDRRV
jgi:hypothetical protein